MAVWVEDKQMAAPGMESQNIHSTCAEGECLPIGQTNPETQGLDLHNKPATRLVPQINYQFYAKPSLPKTTIMCSSANPLQQKRTTFTQEVIRRLLRTRKEHCCDKKQSILNDYMQILKNSGYSTKFRSEILQSGLKGYNKILEDDKSGLKPMYRSKEWCKSARRMDKKKKKSSWLGTYKSCIFVPPTPGSQLQSKLQAIEKEMRPGGRENWPIKIIETSGKTLESVLVKADPFQGNKCSDPKCLPNKNYKNKINCRRNNIGYKIPCKLCPAAYLGESGENMHTRAKSHLSKFYSKTKHIRESSAFFKHIANKHGGVKEGSKFEDYFEICIVKAYRKPITRVVEEGVFIINHEGEILNSKTEWHQPKIIRTTVLQGGAELAGGMIARFPVDGRQGAAAPNVVNTSSQEGSQATTGRTTRAMARRAGGL